MQWRDRNYTTPGVYLTHEYATTTARVFCTGVPVFLGLAKRRDGRTEPLRLSLWSQFDAQLVRVSNSVLPWCVQGFFENGGTVCFVVPLPALTGDALDRALQDSEDIIDIDLVCAPDFALDPGSLLRIQQLILDHCKQTGTRFAILDSRAGDTPDRVSAQWASLEGIGALYYPWVRVRKDDGRVVAVPPCGHIAGIYATSDRRIGVHKAPANEVLHGVVELERQISPDEQEKLNQRRVNCIRVFPGRGIRVWGARTLSGHDAWLYINVRRIFLTAARWIHWNMWNVAFEPNNPRLWARVERELNTYFESQFRKGALKGHTAREAFYIKCDAETNTSETIAANLVVTEIGLAAAAPFEFVVVRLIHGESGVTLTGPVPRDKSEGDRQNGNGREKDPYRGFNFRVEIDGIQRAGFREATGLDTKTDVVRYREGDRKDLSSSMLPGLVTFGTVSLRYGITDDTEFYEWRKTAEDGEVKRKNGSIVLLNEKGEEKVRWNFEEAWVSQWTGPSFNATASEVAIESVQIVHESLKKA